MNSDLSAPLASSREWALPVIVLATTISVASLLRLIVRDGTFITSMILSVVIGIFFLRFTYKSPALKIIILSLVIGVALYLAFSRPYFIIDSAQGQKNYLTRVFVEMFFWIAMAFSIGAVFRPSLAYLPFAFLISFKGTLAQSSGIAISQTDFAIVAELGMFTVIGIIVNNIFLSLRASANRYEKTLSIGGPISSNTMDNYLIIYSIAIHFSNYFYSGIEKVLLDGPLLNWIFNRTSNIILGSVLCSFNPMLVFPQALDLVFGIFDKNYIISNILVLLFQLSCVVAIRRRLFIIIYLIVFDIMHIVIFLASGIFFYKWIFVNSVLVVAVSRMHFQKTPIWLFICSAVLVLISPLFFTIAKLGWYDTRAVNRVAVEAVLDDGSHIRLPSNFFGHYSVTFAQNRVGRRIAPRFPTNAMGGTDHYSTYLRAEHCTNEVVPAADLEARRRELETIRSFVSAYHRFALSQVDAQGRLHYDLFPHHIWSNPMMYPEASKMDLRRVVAYQFVVEALCISNAPTATAIDTETKARTIIPIYLEQQ